MRLDDLFRAFGQALGEAVAENGKFRFDFDGSNLKWNGWNGDTMEAEGWVRLSDLALDGAAPDTLKVALSKHDLIEVKKGKTLAIKVEGDDAGVEQDPADGSPSAPADRNGLWFRLSENTLRILRRGPAGDGARIRITVPPLRRIAIGGSGTVDSTRMADEAEVAIGGSGTIRVSKLEGARLSAKIGGSGRIEAAGSVDALDLSIGGSGKLLAPTLEVGSARIRIGGSGKAEFASDGEVEAKVGGVGDIVVHGQPRCSLKASGSGRIRCVPRGTDDHGDAVESGAAG